MSMKLHIKKGDQVQVIAGDSKAIDGQSPEGRGFEAACHRRRCEPLQEGHGPMHNPPGGIVE